jgi:hypothetical protein
MDNYVGYMDQSRKLMLIKQIRPFNTHNKEIFIKIFYFFSIFISLISNSLNAQENKDINSIYNYVGSWYEQDISHETSDGVTTSVHICLWRNVFANGNVNSQGEIILSVKNLNKTYNISFDLRGAEEWTAYKRNIISKSITLNFKVSERYLQIDNQRILENNFSDQQNNEFLNIEKYLLDELKHTLHAGYTYEMQNVAVNDNRLTYTIIDNNGDSTEVFLRRAERMYEQCQH